MSPARVGQRPELATLDVLEAVATRGRRWTVVFADEQITSVNEAVDREILHGNLVDACTLSSHGERLLADSGHPTDHPVVDLRLDHACRTHSPCWTIECVRCGQIQYEHITDDDVEGHVQSVIAGHLCLGPSAAAKT